MAESNPETQSQTATATFEAGEFSSLLEKEFKPKSDRQKEAVEAAVKTLAEQVLKDTTVVSDDAIKSIEWIIAEIDKKLSDQINQIIHHEDFQKLEGSWRGLHHLVNNTETDEMLKIRVLNISKKDLGKTLKKFKGTAWDQSPIFKKLYEEEFGLIGGEPYGCLVGDYYFDHSPPDVAMLGEISQIAAAAHAPFITGTAPTLLNMDSWQELANPRDLTKFFQHETIPGGIKAWLPQNTLKCAETEVVQFAVWAAVGGHKFGEGRIVIVCVVNDWQSGLPGW